MNIGDIYTTNAGLECQVIHIAKRKKITVKFLITGTVKEVFSDNLVVGKVKDQYYPSCLGVGFDGDFDKSIVYWTKARQLWRNMMKRCYSTTDTRGYKGTVVIAPRWHNFALFLEDISTLDNFNKWLEGGDCSKTRYQLDKDLKGDGTVYSVQTCQFITEHENKSMGAVNARAWDSRYGRKPPVNRQKQN